MATKKPMPPFGRETKANERAEKKLPPALYRKGERAEGEKVPARMPVKTKR